MSVSTSLRAAHLAPGSPCWLELASANEEAARAFYGEIFGWEFYVKRDPATISRRYTIATLGSNQSAGMYQTARDQPTGWMPHLAVANTTNTAEWVEHLGGTVTLGPVDIPDRGSILHAIDPSGAPVVFWQLTPAYSFVQNKAGAFTGVDLNTHDGTSADGFYCRLFNYTSEQIGREGIDYAEWRLEHNPVVYRYVMDTEYQSTIAPHWMVYFMINPARGTDAVAGQALMLGGHVVTPPFDTPFGRTAVLADPAGSVFSIVDHSNPVESGVGLAAVDDPYDD